MTAPSALPMTDCAAAEGRPRHRHHRRHRDLGAQGHAADPRRRAARHLDPALLRPPAARPGRRVPAVPGRGHRHGQRPRHAQARRVVHHHRHARHGDQDAAHLRGRRQGAAGRHGTAADQPPARLPGLRQGRRVPAAEPGDEQRPGRLAASTSTKRTFPKPIAISSNVLLDRERCVLCQRCTRFSEQIAGDPFIDLLERGAAAADRHRRARCRSSPTSPATPCRSARSAR